MSANLIVFCPQCQKKLRLPNREALAKRIRCPGCRTVFRPEDRTEAPEALATKEAVTPAAASSAPARQTFAARRRKVPRAQTTQPKFLVASLVFLLLLVGAGLALWTWFPEYLPLGTLQKKAPAQALVVPKDPKAQPAAKVGPWIQDFAEAKRRAAQEKKDILVSFEGSDWCIWCQRMDKEIFSRPEFLSEAGKQFVLVKADFPHDEPARSRVEDAPRNQALAKRYGVTGYPFVLLTDAAGLAYGDINGFLEGGATPYVEDLEKLRGIRVRRDDGKGNVIGIVNARTVAGFGQDAYGMAVTGTDIAAFLKAHLIGFEPTEADSKIPSWEEIDRRVSPSVAMVIKARPPTTVAAVPKDGLKVEDKLTAADPVILGSPLKRLGVKLQGGQSYKIDMDSDAFNSVLRLEDQLGRQLAVNDDRAAGTVHSTIVYAPATYGTFIVVITNLDGKHGGYALRVVPN